MLAFLLSAFLQAADDAYGSPPPGLTTAGLILMIVSVGGVLTLVATCYYRVLTARRPAD